MKLSIQIGIYLLFCIYSPIYILLYIKANKYNIPLYLLTIVICIGNIIMCILHRIIHNIYSSKENKINIILPTSIKNILYPTFHYEGIIIGIYMINIIFIYVFILSEI